MAILAAGRSTRFGEASKLDALLAERPLIEWIATTGRAIAADHHWLVEQEVAPVESIVQGYERLANAQAALGMATSLRITAQAAQAHGMDALLILLADMPFVTAEHLRRLVAQSHAEPDRPIFSIGPDGVAQPPALFPACFFPALAAMKGDKGARQFAPDAGLIKCPADQLFDVDSVSDLAKAALIAASF